LQSWPGIVHGGGLLGLLDTAATALGSAAAPRTLEGRLNSSVPIDTPLDLEAYDDDGTVRLSVLQAGQTLTSLAIAPLDPDRSRTRATWRGGDDGWSLPMSETCLACGALNPLGLQAGLRFDEDGVWARLEPRSPWCAPGARLHPALAPVVLDEIAWWLGALVTKEGGLTNRVNVALIRPDAPFAGPLLAAGRFDAVTPVDRRGTFWRTETALLGPDGALLATATVIFRGGADYSALQMEYFRSRTPPEIFRRMFPNHAR